MQTAPDLSSFRVNSLAMTGPPLTLPAEEKIILSYDDVQLRLSISAAGRVYDARGSLFLTNKRVRKSSMI